MDNLNPKAMEGEFVTIVGPAGCGRSTLLNILASTLLNILASTLLNILAGINLSYTGTIQILIGMLNSD